MGELLESLPLAPVQADDIERGMAGRAVNEQPRGACHFLYAIPVILRSSRKT